MQQWHATSCSATAVKPIERLTLSLAGQPVALLVSGDLTERNGTYYFLNDQLGSTNALLNSSNGYEIFHLLEMAGGIDLEKSDYDVESPYNIRHLVMANERLYAGKLLFWDRKFWGLVLMREDLKDKLEQRQVKSGTEYRLLNTGLQANL
jgi:hypothetical protein